MRYPNAGDRVMLKPHPLMDRGMCALWRNGRVIWAGPINAPFEDVSFDSITVSIEDYARMKAMLECR
jgi:hypothetical protein